MIVDIHTRIWDSSDQIGSAIDEQMRRSKRHTWSTPSDRPAANAAVHDDAIESIQAAVVLGLQSKFLDAQISHEQVAAYVARDPDKLVGFAGVDPTIGSVQQSIEQAVTLGLQGVTVSPAAQGFHPASTRAMQVYEICQDKGLPVFLETGAAMARQAKMEFAQPFLLDEVARSFPKLKLVLSSMGFPFIEQGLALITKHPQVYADMSELILQPWQLYNTLVLCHQYGVCDQLLFGSNFPFCTPEKAMVTMYSVNTLTHATNLPTVPREVIRSIIEKDSLGCLGIEHVSRQSSKIATPEEQLAGESITVIREEN